MENKDDLGSKETNISLASAKRMHMRSELYNLLHTAFGKEISSRMSASVVNTIDVAREVLEKQ